MIAWILVSGSFTLRPALESGSKCTVLRGTLHDPYTARAIMFIRIGTSANVQIDHVVALADAWRTGASRWTAHRQLTYANDPTVLLAVDGPENESKGDDDASEWLPPNLAYDCAYAKQQIDQDEARAEGHAGREQRSLPLSNAAHSPRAGRFRGVASFY